MLSTMADVPLQVVRLLECARLRPTSSLVTTAVPGGYRQASYVDIAANAARLAQALRALGVRPGDRVATFMWNNQEHVEAYFAVPSMGAVLHPLNIRLAAEQVARIANHAEDRVVIVDASLVAVFARILPALRTVEHVVVTGPADPAALGGSARVALHGYQQIISGQPDDYPWPDVDERDAAAMGYTAGTTGEPKGVVYSHRSICLHAVALAHPEAFNLSAQDTMLVVLPQFHVLGWGLPYTALQTGTSLALPDRFVSPQPLAEFIAAARPNKAAGSPTIWRGLLSYVDAELDADISSLTEIFVGGSALPASLMQAYEQRHGIDLIHAWGMTEMSPLGTVARPPAGIDAAQAQLYRQSQGRFVGPVDARVVGSDGEPLPHNGYSDGEIEVRGPWITASYYRDDRPEQFHDGWLRTGDIGAISPDGYLTLTDRAIDLIRSAGEWISTLEVENHLMAHPAVREAAVIGVPDSDSGERPLAAVVVDEGEQICFAELRDFLAERVLHSHLPQWWTWLAEVPKTSVGRFDKNVLRQQYAAGELDVQLA